MRVVLRAGDGATSVQVVSTASPPCKLGAESSRVDQRGTPFVRSSDRLASAPERIHVAAATRSAQRSTGDNARWFDTMTAIELPRRSGRRHSHSRISRVEESRRPIIRHAQWHRRLTPLLCCVPRSSS